MAERNKVKPDTILKTFWKNNERFADLFNGYLFNGKQVIKPQDLIEADTDISSLLKFNGHVETIQKIMDVVKKSAYGVDFVILGIENQQRVHYAMPLRHMLEDALSYLKEYNELAAKNKKDKNFESSDEFLSNMKKTDRLHPMLTICIYYGEKEWDGPHTFTDMLKIPEEMKELISDYRFNLLEIRKSEKIKFQNSDVSTVFDISRFIYEKNYDKINDKYKEKTIPSELAMVIGSITESQKLIDDAVKSEKEGGEMNMCEALKELEQRGFKQGENVKLISLIQKKIKRGDSIEKIADDLMEEVELIRPIYECIKENDAMTAEEIYQIIKER